MNFYQKSKIKKFFKQKWGWFLGTGLFLIVGGTVAIIGFQLTGWSIVAWLQSRWAVTTIIFVILGLFCLIMLIVLWKRMQMFK